MFYTIVVYILQIYIKLCLKTSNEESFSLYFSSYFHFFRPLIHHLMLLKRTVFSPFCYDKLIEWNIKYVIFWLKKETKKAEECFDIVEFSIKRILMFVNENERDRTINKLINIKIKLKMSVIYNVIGVFLIILHCNSIRK